VAGAQQYVTRNETSRKVFNWKCDGVPVFTPLRAMEFIPKPMVIVHMKRRTLLHAILALPAAFSAIGSLAAGRKISNIEEIRARWVEFLPDGFAPPGENETLTLSKEEWRERLSGQQFSILRQEGTERPFTSALNDEKRAGVFVCAGCDLPLFSSEMKYDSGTGWPSFFTSIPRALETKRDFKLVWPRTEYHCARCGGHQGHIFSDGPAPTNERWCNNGLALRFLAASG
jgi:peptide-methionine (R)-S-oxide reductase